MNILEEANQIKEEIIKHRRYLHQNPEIGFELTNTKNYVKKELEKMGYQPIECGQCGLYATIGQKKGKTFLLRADMDALNIKEETQLDYSSNNQYMHACGHDMHTAMLLGAAHLLKKHENEINGQVKLMFQPAEEIFEGSLDMINNGILNDVDAALMIHVLSGLPFESGQALICAPGISAPGADLFEIQIQGKGTHGSMPEKGIDPLNVAVHIYIALQEIIAREISIQDNVTLTIGAINGGNAANIIPDQVIMKGSLRTYNEEIRHYIKKRICEISESCAKTFRASANVIYTSGAPSLNNDKSLANDINIYTKELLGSKAINIADLPQSIKSTGSEDFAYISQEVPSLMISLAAGNSNEGYHYPLHHPKVTFDEEALPVGSAILAYNAIKWLNK